MKERHAERNGDRQISKNREKMKAAELVAEVTRVGRARTLLPFSIRLVLFLSPRGV